MNNNLIHEEKMDLFSVPNDYYIAHCISGDYSLGAGIAKKINKIYAMKYKLEIFYPNKHDKICALLMNNVFNLVTKRTLFDKPTYDTLKTALLDMKKQCLKNKITKIAMPHLGCGMDTLEWSKVKPIIYDVFDNTGIEILICYL